MISPKLPCLGQTAGTLSLRQGTSPAALMLALGGAAMLARSIAKFRVNTGPKKLNVYGEGEHLDLKILL